MRKLTFCLLLATALYCGCSKENNNNNTNPCAGVTVTVTGTSTNPSSGQNNGSIAATATGGTGFTYSLNGGSYQASGSFSNLAAGTYTVTAKNSSGCTGSKQFTLTAASASCQGTTITITTTTTTATPCGGAGGSITVTASGSTGFTYQVNGGAFQASNQFTNLAAGNHTVTAKDANGCTQNANVSIAASPAGNLFSQVRTVLQNFCVTCHNPTNPNGGKDWTNDCNIVANGALIKTKAVDLAGTPNQMPQPPNPPLSAADQQKIVNWLNAGGQYNH